VRSVFAAMRSVFLFILGVLLILALVVAPLGYLCVKLLGVVENEILKYAIAMVGFSGICVLVKKLGSKVIEIVIGNRD